jgi:hypothetical protein
MTELDDVRSLRESLATEFDDLYADLEHMAEAVRAAVVSPGPVGGTDRVGPFDDDQLRAMRDQAIGLLSRRRMADGAGFIFDPDRIAIAEQLIQWQVRSQAGGFEPYGFVYDTDSTEYYDFMRLPWFETPRRTGGPTLAGPYLDYLGVDDYVLTATVPITGGGVFVGVAGADIPVSTLERIVLSRCRGLDVAVALVTAEDRIVCSNSAHYLPGDRLPQGPETGTRMSLPTRVPTLAVQWGAERSA